MPPSDALNRNRAAIRQLIEKSRVRNPRVFGSVFMGQDKEGSDLDLLVDPMPGTTLFDLGGLQVELENLLGVRVDLLTPQDLPARYREKVLRESVPI